MVFRTSIILLSFVLSSCSDDRPLSFDLPKNWVLDYQKLENLDFHTFRVENSNESVLMLSRWPPKGSAREIPKLVKELADSFATSAINDPALGAINVDYGFNNFTGVNCSGSYAVFEFNENGQIFVQTMFMLEVESEIWNGQFTGSLERWELAKQVLLSVGIP